jgi:hypothetical protein
VVLDTVNQFLGMLNPHAERKGLRLHENIFAPKHLEYVARRMPRGEDYCLSIKPVTGSSDNAGGTPVPDHQVNHFLTKQYRAARLTYTIADGRNDTWQLVRANMRVGVEENVDSRAMNGQDLQYSPDVSTFTRSGIEFSIGIGPGAALTETVIRFRIYNVTFVDGRQVAAAFPYILAALKDYGPVSHFKKANGCKKTSGARAHDNNRTGP